MVPSPLFFRHAFGHQRDTRAQLTGKAHSRQKTAHCIHPDTVHESVEYSAQRVQRYRVVKCLHPTQFVAEYSGADATGKQAGHLPVLKGNTRIRECLTTQTSSVRLFTLTTPNNNRSNASTK